VLTADSTAAMKPVAQASSIAAAARHVASAPAGSAFLQGLITPSPLAALVMVLTCLVVLALPLMIVTQDFMRERGIEFVPDTPKDFDTFASIRALQLGAHRGPAPVVVITGSSTTRDALDSAYLGSALAAHGRGDAEVFKLTTPRQNLWLSVAMLDAVPAGARGVALVGVTPGLFITGPERLRELVAQPRLAFRSRAYDKELERLAITPGLRYGVYLLDNLDFFGVRRGAIVRNLLLRDAPAYSERVVRGNPHETPERWDSVGRRLADRFTGYDENVRYGEGALDRALARLREETRLVPVLIEAPVNPRFLDEFGQRELFARHAARMSAFAAERSVRYLDLNAEIELMPEHFWDWAHLQDEASVEHCSRTVAAATVELLPLATP
jgi:hypothetical protein